MNENEFFVRYFVKPIVFKILTRLSASIRELVFLGSIRATYHKLNCNFSHEGNFNDRLYYLYKNFHTKNNIRAARFVGKFMLPNTRENVWKHGYVYFQGSQIKWHVITIQWMRDVCGRSCRFQMGSSVYLVSDKENRL